jgi:hypothetical protein
MEQLTLSKESIKASGVAPYIIKASADMLESTNITGVGLEGINPENVGYIPLKGDNSSSILDYLPKVSVNSATVVITNEVSDDGTPDIVYEGDGKPQIDFDDNVSKPTLKKFAGYIKISEEMINDISFMDSQIRGVLMRRLRNTIADSFMADLLAATPTYDAGDLTAGTTGTLVKDIPPAVTADMQDLGGYSMNLWMLPQPYYAKMFNEAGTNFLWYALNEPTIMNNNNVTAGNIVAIDSSMFPLYVYKDMAITFGREGDDMTKNMITVRCESRIGWNLAGNSLKAIYNDTISATLAAIL